MKNFLWNSTRSVMLGAAVVYGWVLLTSVDASDLSNLKNADIVFQTSQSSQSAAILLASKSAYSHVGIIEIDSAGKTFVLEAVGPVKLTPLDKWIHRGLGNRIAIKRLKTITPELSKKVLLAAHKYDGAPYDVFFHSSKNQIYCSELVELAFAEAILVSLGTFQKAKDLDLDNFAATGLINMRWQRHPNRQTASETFDGCFAKTLEQELITPASIFNDEKLELVYTNYKVVP